MNVRHLEGIEVTEIKLDGPLSEHHLEAVRAFLKLAIRQYNDLRSSPPITVGHMLRVQEAADTIDRLSSIITQHDDHTRLATVATFRRNA